MHGVISITDWDWFQYLRSQPLLDEVNFWRPRDLEKPSITPGTPFIFKLRKGKGDRIVGYGVFAGHSVLPGWLAWEAFGDKNGAVDFAEMRERLERLRRDPEARRGAGDYPIGCVMLSSPVFLRDEYWIEPPSDWSPNIVQGKGYDLSVGEGARVWQELLAVSEPDVERELEFGASDAGNSRYGAPQLVSPRLGQGAFRVAVTDAYGRACAVTTEHSLPVLEAAHIRPYALNGTHDLRNGLLLRTDIHRLFDKGYVTVSPEDYRFVVSSKLREDFANGRAYYAMHGIEISRPRALSAWPARENLEWHTREVFRG